MAHAYTEADFRKVFKTFAITYWVGIPLTIVLVGIPLIIIAAVYSCILLYRAWAIMQDKGASTTPGRAVGFCFIPFYNFYWVFRAYASLAEDTGRYLGERGVEGSRISFGLAVAYGVLFILSSIPYLGLITAIPTVIIYYLLLAQVRDTSLAVLAASGDSSGNAPAGQ